MATYTVTTGNDTTAYTVSTGARGPAGSDANVTSSNILAASGLVTDPTASVVVDASGTDDDRGTALIAAYATAKAMTPGGSSLSASNRVSVIIPPGKYKLSGELLLDTNYVDLIALVPGKGGSRSQNQDSTNESLEDLTYYKPTSTIIYTENPASHTVRQTAHTIKMCGFTISQMATTSPGTNVRHALHIDISTTASNYGSEYDMMYFWTYFVSTYYANPVGFRYHGAGTWRHCIANAQGWRIRTVAGIQPRFRCTMFDCEGGPYAYAGDAPGGAFENSYMERCSAVGKWQGAEGAAFGGCGTYGVNHLSTSVFIDCVSGVNSFALGRNAGGTYIRCRAGETSFGSTVQDSETGKFTGVAIDCIAGRYSFGGNKPPLATSGKCTGELTRCIVTDNDLPLRVEGANIRSCRITNAASNVDGITLLDSNSVISDTDIIVAQGGTGVPINAGSALNVAAYGCRMNNASNDADGLGANVTNLVATPNNVVSDSVS